MQNDPARSFLLVRGKKSFRKWWKSEGMQHSLAVFIPLCVEGNVFRLLLQKNEEDVMWEKAFFHALHQKDESLLLVLREFISFERFFVPAYQPAYRRLLQDDENVNKCFLYLLTQGLPPLLRKDEEDFTLWHYACLNGNPTLVEAFLQTSSFPIDVVADGRTGLFLACAYWNLPAVKILLQKGADINFLSGEGITCLGMTIYTACRFNARIVSEDAYEIIALLLDISSPQLHGEYSPASVFLRSPYQHTRILRLLLAKNVVPQEFYLNDDGSFKDSYLDVPFEKETQTLLCKR